MPYLCQPVQNLNLFSFVFWVGWCEVWGKVAYALRPHCFLSLRSPRGKALLMDLNQLFPPTCAQQKSKSLFRADCSISPHGLGRLKTCLSFSFSPKLISRHWGGRISVFSVSPFNLRSLPLKAAAVAAAAAMCELLLSVISKDRYKNNVNHEHKQRV